MRSSSSSDRPLCSNLLDFFSRPWTRISNWGRSRGRNVVQHTFWTSLCSAAASTTAATYSPKPSVSNALVMWSQPIVFLASLSEISFASEEMRVMNSTQHSINRSLASLENAIPVDAGKISLTIFWTVAAGELAAVGEPSDIFRRGMRLPYPWARTDRRWLEEMSARALGGNTAQLEYKRGVPEVMDGCISQTGCRDKSIPCYLDCATACHMEGNDARQRCLHATGADLPPHWMPTIPSAASEENLLGREHRNAQVTAWADKIYPFVKRPRGNRAQTWYETD